MSPAAGHDHCQGIACLPVVAVDYRLDERRQIGTIDPFIRSPHLGPPENANARPLASRHVPEHLVERRGVSRSFGTQDELPERVRV